MQKLAVLLFLFFALEQGFASSTPIMEDIGKLKTIAKDLYRDIKTKARPFQLGSRPNKNYFINKDDEKVIERIKITYKTIKLLEHELQLTTKSGQELESLNKKIVQGRLDQIGKQMQSLFTLLKKRKLSTVTTIKAGEDLLQSFRTFEATLLKKTTGLKKQNEKLDQIIEVKKKTLKFESAAEVCHTVAAPGDIILRKALLLNGDTDNDFSKSTMGWINFLETLKGNDHELNYRHAELITHLADPYNITTMSYYPWQFNIGKEEKERMPMFLKIDNNLSKKYNYTDYRKHYTVLRVNSMTYWGETKARELALWRSSLKKSYTRIGTCADWINWTYFHTITSDWNQIPLIKQAMQLAYLPEGVQTPDNLHDSYMTEKICEVDHEDVIHPKRILVKPLLARLKSRLSSTNQEVAKHAKVVMERLKKDEVVDQNGAPLIDIINVHAPGLIPESSSQDDSTPNNNSPKDEGLLF